MPDQTIKPDPRAIDVFVTEDMLLVSLADGRELSVPLAWSSRLAAASPAEQANWRLTADGEGIFWPGIDETVVVASLLRLA
jgi:hypothetical protein